MPNPFGPKGRRSVSNVPAQSLILMNDPFVVEQAGVWAAKLLSDPASTPEQRIASLYMTALAREPTRDEASAMTAFLQRQSAARGIDDWQDNPEVWTDACHVMFNLKEFIFIH